MTEDDSVLIDFEEPAVSVETLARDNMNAAKPGFTAGKLVYE